MDFHQHCLTAENAIKWGVIPWMTPKFPFEYFIIILLLLPVLLVLLLLLWLFWLNVQRIVTHNFEHIACLIVVNITEALANMPANIEPTQISFSKRNFRIGQEKRKCQKKNSIPHGIFLSVWRTNTIKKRKYISLKIFFCKQLDSRKCFAQKFADQTRGLLENEQRIWKTGFIESERSLCLCHGADTI